MVTNPLRQNLKYCFIKAHCVHYTQFCKNAIIIHMPYNFFHTRNNFTTVLYMDNDIHTNFFRKIFAALYEVCKRLYSPLLSNQMALVSMVPV